MTGRPDTTVDLYDLVELTVDGKPVEFTAATITQETVWMGSGERQHTVRRWHGQIVWDGSRIDAALLHTLVGRTNDHTLRGFFRISRAHSLGVDIDDSGALILT